jgi:hypothetical protein
MTTDDALAKTSRQWKIADTFAIIGLVILSFYYLTGFRFDTLFTVEPRQADFRIYYTIPPLIFEHLKYPAALGDPNNPFPYLPSAVLMMLPISMLPRLLAFGIWILIQAISFAVVLQVGLRLSGMANLPGRWLVALVAVLMVELPLSWDFRNHNNNMIYLALIMLSLITRKTWLSGLLLAISFNLKLYSGLLFAGFIWRREYRLAAVMAVASIALGVVLPVVVFGFTGYLQVMSQWLNELRYTISPVGQLEAPATLLKSVKALVGTDTNSTIVTVIAGTSLAVWTALVIGYFFLARRSRPGNNSDKARLSDVCVLLLAPLPFSTRFTPYHAIVLLPAFLILLSGVIEKKEPWLRVIALSTLIGSQLLLLALPSWELRSLMYLLSFAFVVTALGIVRYAERSQINPMMAAASS